MDSLAAIHPPLQGASPLSPLFDSSIFFTEYLEVKHYLSWNIFFNMRLTSRIHKLHDTYGASGIHQRHSLSNIQGHCSNSESVRGDNIRA